MKRDKQCFLDNGCMVIFSTSIEAEKLYLEINPWVKMTEEYTF